MRGIVLENVSKQFSGASTPSLLETSLQIEPGSFVTVLGTSGSGKTTLLKLMNRLYRPSGGRVLIDGQDTAEIPETRLRRQMGYVIQQVGLFQHMTVAANVAMVPSLLRWSKAKTRDRVDELLSLVGLSPDRYREMYPRQLSGGQQQRVGLARALAGDPAILLMDEPFGALDVIIRQTLQDELLAIQSRLQKTVVFVTHDVEEALKLGDKVIVMHQGRVQQYDTPANILAAPANAFVHHLLGADDPHRHFDRLLVRQALQASPANDSILEGAVESMSARWPRVRDDQSLNDALQGILQGSTDYVVVEDRRQRVVGRVTLASLQRIRQSLNALLSKEHLS